MRKAAGMAVSVATFEVDVGGFGIVQSKAV